MTIDRVQSDEEIAACLPALQELRPYLAEEQFVPQVRRQMERHGYTLVAVRDRDEVVAAAGYRIAEYLAWGRAFYVDDLITRESARRHGYGGKLLDWLIERAREEGCQVFHLDSGTQRFDAHRLYLSRKMRISSHHFRLDLE